MQFQNLGCAGLRLHLTDLTYQAVGQAQGVALGHLNRHFFVVHAFEGFHGIRLHQVALHHVVGFAHRLQHHLDEQAFELLGSFTQGLVVFALGFATQLAQARRSRTFLR